MAKDKASLKEVEQFTVGNDREFDLLLAPFDVLGSIAHATMLETVGLLTKQEKRPPGTRAPPYIYNKLMIQDSRSKMALKMFIHK